MLLKHGQNLKIRFRQNMHNKASIAGFFIQKLNMK